MSQLNRASFPTLPGRTCLASVALAAALAVGGCNTSGSSEDTTRPRSIQTTGVTRIPEQMQSNVMNFPGGDPSKSVLRVEQVSPSEVRAGSEYTYQVKVTNLTSQPLQDVLVRASQPEGMNVRDAGTGPDSKRDAEGMYNYNVGTLGPRESRTFQVSGTPTGNGVIRQTYDVKYEQKMATAVKVTQAAVAVTKDGPKEVDVCQEITWNYVVRNTGNGVARGVTLRDTLPAGLSTTDGGAAVTADLGDIPAGQTRQATAHLKAAHSGQYASAATVTSDAGEAKSESVTTVARQPKLDLTIKGPDKDYVGKPLTYTVTVTNSGDTAAQKAVLRLTPSTGAQMGEVTDASGARIASATGSRDSVLGTIDAGQSKAVNVTLQASQGGPLRVEATASGQCATAVSKSADTEIMTVAALLLEAVDVADPVKVGENVVYRIRVTNQGNGPDTNIKVTATLPDAETYVKASGVSDASNAGQTITFAPVKSLAPKESATWEVTAKATKAADVQFKVTATSDAVKVPAEKTEPTKLY